MNQENKLRNTYLRCTKCQARVLMASQGNTGVISCDPAARGAFMQNHLRNCFGGTVKPGDFATETVVE